MTNSLNRASKSAKALSRTALAVAFLSPPPAFPQQHNQWQTAMNAASKVSARGDYAEAEKELNLAVFQAEMYGRNDQHLVLTLTTLGELCEKQRKFPAAELVYKRVLEIWERALGPNEVIVAKDMLKLAAVYREEGKNVEAESAYKQSMAIIEKGGEKDSPTMAPALQGLAETYRAAGKLPEAEKLLKRALAITEKAFGPDYPEVAQCLENYAALLRKTNRTAEAEKMQARANAIHAAHAAENSRK